jgi:MYXO-CTERM domain-containing protein
VPRTVRSTVVVARPAAGPSTHQRVRPVPAGLPAAVGVVLAAPRAVVRSLEPQAGGSGVPLPLAWLLALVAVGVLRRRETPASPF